MFPEILIGVCRSAVAFFIFSEAAVARGICLSFLERGEITVHEVTVFAQVCSQQSFQGWLEPLHCQIRKTPFAGLRIQCSERAGPTHFV